MSNVLSGGSYETGSTGPAGPIGPMGAQGFQGPAGDVGPPGVQGLPGPVGPQGFQGPAGDVGPPGVQGLQGPLGATGAQGPAGNDGATGAQGPTGPAGAATSSLVVFDAPETIRTYIATKSGYTAYSRLDDLNGAVNKFWPAESTKLWNWTTTYIPDDPSPSAWLNTRASTTITMPGSSNGTTQSGHQIVGIAIGGRRDSIQYVKEFAALYHIGDDYWTEITPQWSSLRFQSDANAFAGNTDGNSLFECVFFNQTLNVAKIRIVPVTSQYYSNPSLRWGLILDSSNISDLGVSDTHKLISPQGITAPL